MKRTTKKAVKKNVKKSDEKIDHKGFAEALRNSLMSPIIAREVLDVKSKWLGTFRRFEIEAVTIKGKTTIKTREINTPKFTDRLNGR